MAAADVLQWLPSVEGLLPEVCEQARDLFEKHRVDKAFLDFIVSEEGALIMDAHRRGREAEVQVAEVIAPLVATGPLPPQKGNKLCGRQKIDRQSEGHYFKRQHYGHTDSASSSQKLQSAPSQKRPAACEPTEAALPPQKPTVTSPIRAAKNDDTKVCRDFSRGKCRFGDACKFSHSDGKIEALSDTPRTPSEVPSSSPSPPSASSATTAPRTSDRKSTASSNSDGLNVVVQHPRDGEQVEGTVKSFNKEKGFGFIHSPQVERDIFLQSCHLPDQECPEPGTHLRCSLFHNKEGRPQARDVVWLVHEATEQTRYSGTLRSMGDAFGFIACAETFSKYGRDVFVHPSQLPEGWELQQKLSFEISTNAQGHPQAKNISRTVPAIERLVEPVAPRTLASRW